MTTHLTHAELREPPPEMHDLLDGARRVGWIAGDLIGFAGFRTTDEAAHGAGVAHAALARWAARRLGQPLPPQETPRLTVVSDAAGRWVEADGTIVARLLAPEAGAPAPRAIAIELALPIRAGAVAARSAAYVAYRALRRAGLRLDESSDAAADVARGLAGGAAPSGGTTLTREGT